MAGAERRRDLVPTFRVRVNGRDLPSQAAADLIAVTVDLDLGAPGMFALRLVNWDAVRARVTWSDEALFGEGNEVEIEMGYVEGLETVLTGEITGLEPAFSAGEMPTVTVRGYDRGHRLLRGRKTRSFSQVKDNDIAAQIAGDLGLTAQAEDTGVTLEYVLQHNQTDMAFLQERARRIGYEVWVEDKTLHFRPRGHAGSEVLTLARDGDLIEFHPRTSTLSQVGQVEVRGWSTKDKAALAGQAGVGDVRTSMGGATSGPAAAEDAFGAASVASVERPVASQAEADQMAQGRFRERALAYVRGQGTCIGRSDLRAGAVVLIEGLGERFSGRYYVVSARHSYSTAHGYRTAFEVRRNAT